MLISYPFLTDQASEDADAEAIRYSFTGSYPLNSFGEWHNGVHLVAPTLNDGSVAPVRAVADGKVVLAIAPKAENKTDKAQNYGAFSDNPEWTDNGLVILEHTAEIGHDGTNSVALKFYSVYMHLKSLGKIKVKNAQGQALERELQEGDKLWRKDVVGEAGQIYGQPRHMHFEISMDDSNLGKLLGHAPGLHPKADAAPSGNGRSSVVFGSAYVYLPVGTPLSTTEPATHMGTRTTEALQTPLWVQVDYTLGNATLTSYDAVGDNAGRPIAGAGQLSTSQCSEIEGEYKLYEQANKRHNSLSATQKAQSSPSGWYELLRFGRVLGIDPLPAEAEHWRKIKTPAGERWANLNASGTFKFSDADFPAFLGWQCIDDDSEGASGQDQRCDSPTLRSLLLRQFADVSQREKATAKTLEGRKLLASKATNPSDDALKNKLRKLICKFPSEFDKSTIDARYAHVKEEPYFKENPKNWADLKEHMQAVCVDLPAGYKAAQWHFHPVAFVNHMRRCGWLDAATLRRIYSDTPEVTIQKYIPDLNRVTRKYGFNTPNRLPHFIGQGGVESAYMNTMIEWAQTLLYKDNKPYGGPVIPDSKKEESTFGHWWGTLPTERVDWYGNRKYNSKGDGSGAPYDWNSDLGNLGAPDGQKFRGRGFKQLTGRANYSKYWLYRGWLQASSFDDNWWFDPQYVAKNESNMKKRAAPVNDPERISIHTFNCMDTGGWFMTFEKSRVIKSMDAANQGIDDLIQTVTRAINGGTNGLTARTICTKKAMEILK